MLKTKGQKSLNNNNDDKENNVNWVKNCRPSALFGTDRTLLGIMRLHRCPAVTLTKRSRCVVGIGLQVETMGDAARTPALELCAVAHLESSF